MSFTSNLRKVLVGHDVFHQQIESRNKPLKKKTSLLKFTIEFFKIVKDYNKRNMIYFLMGIEKKCKFSSNSFLVTFIVHFY